MVLGALTAPALKAGRRIDEAGEWSGRLAGTSIGENNIGVEPDPPALTTQSLQLGSERRPEYPICTSRSGSLAAFPGQAAGKRATCASERASGVTEPESGFAAGIPVRLRRGDPRHWGMVATYRESIINGHPHANVCAGGRAGGPVGREQRSCFQDKAGLDSTE